MTGLIAIDESGDLGSAGSRIFSMAAIITLRSRNLKIAADFIPNDRIEHKWNNTIPENRKKLLTIMATLNFNVVYTAVDKNRPSNNHPVYGNVLYEKVLREVMSDAMDVLPCRDVVILLDSSRFISGDRMREIAGEEALYHNVNLVKIDKINSSHNKCIQLADFVAGASRAYYEIGDKSIEIIREKVSIARRH